MKKFFAIAILAVAFAACTSSDKKEETPATTDSTVTEAPAAAVVDTAAKAAAVVDTAAKAAAAAVDSAVKK